VSEKTLLTLLHTSALESEAGGAGEGARGKRADEGRAVKGEESRERRQSAPRGGEVQKLSVGPLERKTIKGSHSSRDGYF
jgi:hypothetical protein